MSPRAHAVCIERLPKENEHWMCGSLKPAKRVSCLLLHIIADSGTGHGGARGWSVGFLSKQRCNLDPKWLRMMLHYADNEEDVTRNHHNQRVRYQNDYSSFHYSSSF